MIKGIIGSIIIHLLLLFSFLFVRVGLSFEEPQFVEIGLLAYTPPEVVAKIEKDLEPTRNLIELPSAEHTEEEAIRTKPFKETPRLPMPEVSREKLTPEPIHKVIEGKPYRIEGELAKRRVIYKVIPEYPRGYNIETDVKVEVFVSPSGRVKRLSLLKKGGAVFDRITLDALRVWRFEKLHPHLPQEIERGVVTFMYRLREQ